MRHADDLGLEEYRAAIAVTRIVLGPKARVQAPPNLVDLEECRALLDAGVDDWGGVSPLTPDHVNPERPWPSLERLRAITARGRLRAAGPADRAPGVRRAPASRGSTRGSRRTSPRSPTTTGSPSPAYARPACRGRSPTAASPSVGRTDLHAAIDTEGRTEDRRSDFDDVYGDWDARQGSRAGRSGGRGARTPATCLETTAPARRARGRRGRPGQPDRRAGAGPDDRRGRPARAGVPAGRRPAPGDRRRRGHLRRQPEHQLHQRLLRRLPVLRVRPAAHRRRRLLAVPGPGRRPGRGGVGARRDRGLHAGRHRPRAARHGVLRPRRRGEAAGAGHARARLLPDGGRQRRHPHRAVDRGLPDQGPRGRPGLASPAPPRRSSTTRSAGC